LIDIEVDVEGLVGEEGFFDEEGDFLLLVAVQDYAVVLGVRGGGVRELVGMNVSTFLAFIELHRFL